MEQRVRRRRSRDLRVQQPRGDSGLSPASRLRIAADVHRHSTSDDDSGCVLEEYAWWPSGLKPDTVHLYFACLPDDKVPYVGSAGEKWRARQLRHQLPPQDSDARYCSELIGDEADDLRMFDRARKAECIGVGLVQRVPYDGRQRRCKGAPPLMNRPIAPPGVGMSGMGQVQMGPVVSMAPGAPRPLLGAPMGGVMPPQPLMTSMQMRPPGMPFGAPQPLMQARMGMPPPGAHVFPGMQQMGGPIADAEFEEIMNRNRTVSSSAISRAVADAAAGDPKAAIETLMTAITLIKQSRVAHDDRCRLLIAGLQDTLTGIESKMGSYGSSSRGSRYRDRDRSRSRERDRKRRRRSRSSSGSRSRSRSPRHRSSRHY